MTFKINLMTILILPMLILLVAGAYYRFVILHDYLVSYEIECDPYVSSCYIGCEDENCKSEYYYAIIEKYAYSLFTSCGSDVLECDQANICTQEEAECSIDYCDSLISEAECFTLVVSRDDIVNPSEKGKALQNQVNKIEL